MIPICLLEGRACVGEETESDTENVDAENVGARSGQIRGRF
jgi:hypothetical protein